MKKIVLVAIGVILLFSVESFGQKGYKFRPPHKQSWTWNKFRHGYWSVGFGLNAMNYFGDITPYPGFYSTDLSFTKFNFSIFALKRISPSFTTRFMFSYGTMEGADSLSASPSSPHDQFRYIRNLSFRNTVYEATVMGVFDLKTHRDVFYDRPLSVIPYLLFGVGVLYHNPEAQRPQQFGGGWVDLQPLGTEGQGRDGYDTKYSKVQICIPLGIGFRKRIAQRWDLSVEFTARYLLTDYLDDVSRNYVDLGVFGDDDLTRALHDRSREGGRNLRLETPYTPPDYTYIGKDGRQYTTFLGYGNDQYPDNIRGNATDRDTYTVVGIHLAYIIPGQVRCPEPFRNRGGKFKKGFNFFFNQKGAMR